MAVETLLLRVVAGALWLLAAGIALVQRRARTCTVHSHRAGQVALALAVACTVAGAALWTLAASWERGR